MDVRLTKQHLSTRVFATYFQYVEKHYPNVDLEKICQAAGLPMEYCKNGDNWVSVIFDLKFMEQLKQEIHDPDLDFKVGQFSMSREALGGPLFALGKNALSTSYILNNSWKLASYLNKVVTIEIKESVSGQIKFSLRPIFAGMDKEEVSALSQVFPSMIQNSAGYYSAIPLLKGRKGAKVEFQKIEEGNFEISVAYQDEVSVTAIAVLGNVATATAVAVGSYMHEGSWRDMFYGLLAIATFNFYLAWRHIRKIREVFNETEVSLQKIDSQYSAIVETKINLQARLRESEAINQLTNHLIRTSTEEELLSSACRDLTQVLEYDRAVVFLADPTEKFLEFRGGFLPDQAMIAAFRQIRFEIDIPSPDPTKISNVFRNKASILISDVAKHLPTLNAESQQVLKYSRSKSFVCVPIMTEHKSLGVLLADNFASEQVLTLDDERLLGVAGRQIAITLEKQRAQAEVEAAMEKTAKLAESYSRFVPWETIRLLGYNSVLDVDISAGQEIQLAIAFCDIRGFTTMSEQMSPVESVAFLNSYFGHLAPVFQRHNGIIDKFLGDGIMALFLSPEDAVNAMKEFQMSLNQYNLIHRSGKARIPIKAGIGLHFGKVLLGAVGFDKRLSISVVSDAVNLASRLDGLTKKFGVDCVLTDDVIHRLDGRENIRLIAQLKVEGRESLTNVYEIYRHLDSLQRRERDLAAIEIEKVVGLIRDQKLDMAAELVAVLLVEFPIDPVVIHYAKHLGVKLHKATAA